MTVFVRESVHAALATQLEYVLSDVSGTLRDTENVSRTIKL